MGRREGGGAVERREGGGGVQRKNLPSMTPSTKMMRAA